MLYKQILDIQSQNAVLTHRLQEFENSRATAEEQQRKNNAPTGIPQMMTQLQERYDALLKQHAQCDITVTMAEKEQSIFEKRLTESEKIQAQLQQEAAQLRKENAGFAYLMADKNRLAETQKHLEALTIEHGVCNGKIAFLKKDKERLQEELRNLQASTEENIKGIHHEYFKKVEDLKREVDSLMDENKLVHTLKASEAAAVADAKASKQRVQQLELEAAILKERANKAEETAEMRLAVASLNAPADKNKSILSTKKTGPTSILFAEIAHENELKQKDEEIAELKKQIERLDEIVARINPLAEAHQYCHLKEEKLNETVNNTKAKLEELQTLHNKLTEEFNELVKKSKTAASIESKLISGMSTVSSQSSQILVQKAETMAEKAKKQLDKLKPYIGCNVESVVKNGKFLGVKIISIKPNSPIEAAKLKVGDIIKKVDDKVVPDKQGFLNAIMEYGPGDELVLEYQRNILPIKVSITVGANGISMEDLSLLLQAAYEDADAVED